MKQKLIGTKLEILGHGSIQLVDVMGDDAAIVSAARKSYTLEDDCDDKKMENLIRYMVRHGHTSPFEMAEVKFLVRVPMDVWRQWIRHRTANVNEYSTRYSEAIPPEPIETPFRTQSKGNKQGSGEQMDAFMNAWYCEEEGRHVCRANDLYLKAIKDGMSREQARRFLPLSTWTEAVWKIDIHNCMNFLRLRLDEHAQFEIRQYAKAIEEFIKKLFPITYRAYKDYVFDAITFSASEQEALSYVFKSYHKTTDYGNLSTREVEEFKEKLWKIWGIGSC